MVSLVNGVVWKATPSAAGTVVQSQAGLATQGLFDNNLSLAVVLGIGNAALRNRLVFQPHFTALGGVDGLVSEAHVAYHAERARGGVGLIVFESQAVHPTGKMSGSGTV